MKSLNGSSLVRLVSSLLLAVATVALPAASAAAADKDVNVVNTPGVVIVNGSGQPVPVTGRLQLTTTPTEIFQQQLEARVDGTIGGVRFPMVPQGKRLVVEHVSVEVENYPAESATQMVLRVGPYIGAVFAPWHALVPTPIRSFGVSSKSDLFVTSQPIRIYVDAFYMLYIQLTRDALASAAYIRATVTGYFVDMP